MTGASWPATVLAAGAVISIFSVTLVVIYGQTRILFAMARDGMIPQFFHKLNPRTLTPVGSTLFVAVILSLLAGVVPIDFLFEMTSIGTLVAFLIVSIGVMVLRQRQPDLPRGFKVPLYPAGPDRLDRGLHLDHPGPASGDDLRLPRLGHGGADLVLRLQHQALDAREGEQVMTMVVGFAPDGRGHAVLHLAAMLARSGGEDLVVCAVVPEEWPPSPAQRRRRVPGVRARRGRERAEPRAGAAGAGRDGDLPGRARALGRAAGLLEVASEVSASLIVLGSAADAGSGMVALGSRQLAAAAQLARPDRARAARVPARRRARACPG